MIIHPKFDEFDAGELSSYDQPTIIRFALSLWFIILNHSDILCYFVIFLNQIKSATLLSLPLPLLVFLWGTLTVPRPSKNFWVTIIAYTQVSRKILFFCRFKRTRNVSVDRLDQMHVPIRILTLESGHLLLRQSDESR